jgi:diguanylate cyclase (GGDEF)-like protein
MRRQTGEFLTLSHLASEPIQALKLRVYRTVVLFGIVTLLTVWAAEISQGTISPFNYALRPVLAAVFTGLGLLLWRSQKYVRLFEIISFVCVFAYFLGQLYVILDQLAVVTFTTFPQWIPIIYIMAFLIFDTRPAALASALFLLAALALGLIFATSTEVNSQTLNFRSGLVQIYLSHVIYITLLSVLAVLKERYIRSGLQTETLIRLATRDAVTGAHNRRYLDLLLKSALDQAQRYARPVSVILIDIDRFKQVNDAHGHGAGDRILRQFAELIQPHIRAADHFGRWGGEEFLSIGMETDLEHARQFAERLRGLVAEHLFEYIGSMTASFGVAAYRIGDAPETLIARADAALYRAKSNGRNRVECEPREEAQP